MTLGVAEGLEDALAEIERLRASGLDDDDIRGALGDLVNVREQDEPGDDRNRGWVLASAFVIMRSWLAHGH